ncbi:MAG: DUF1501 domain-containing protein [Xanthomonadales bacterium]|nr:DUF1501 domain-containing protein [Xanthomonadales bacterium]
MKRRELIKSMAAATFASGATGLVLPSWARAECLPVAVPDMDRTVVNFMLNGGADVRFLFMPAPGTLAAAHEALIYSSRKNMFAYGRANPGATYSDFFAANYTIPINDSSIGIHNRAGWLLSEFEAGRVAVVANAVCSKNRRHDQSILNANAGTPEYNELVYDVSGWGGRLVEQVGPTANAVELGGSITVYSQGSTQGSRLEQAIHAANTRDIALPSDVSGTGRREVVTRALKSYYEARKPEVAGNPADWPFHTFFKHNADFRDFGDAMADCMATRGSLPPTLLHPNSGGTFDLFSGSLEQQCRNLYDVCLAPDVLGSRTVSMSYGGWDTHGNQEPRAGNNWQDIFGTDKGMDRVMSEISSIPSNAYDNLVFYFASDFGRQLVTNGDLGTDHGRGIYSILIGSDINGGTYGTMFPPEEAVDNGSYVPLERHGADITGKTSTERIIAEISEWALPAGGGTADAVVPNWSSSDIESPGLLNSLFV